MARRKTDSAKVAKEPVSPQRGGIPSFNENALSALTAKIEKGFEAGKPHQSREDTRGQKGTSKTNNRRTTKPQSRMTPTELVRGTKRDVRGNVKLPGKQVGKSGGPSAKQKNGKGNDDRVLLLKEILALGGTEEDLDLVADAPSDEEDSDSNAAPPDKSFRKDLANFVAGLGIEGELHEVESGRSNDENTGDGWEDASDLNTLTGSDGGAGVRSGPAALLHNPPSDDPKRLVSNIFAGATGLTDSQ